MSTIAPGRRSCVTHDQAEALALSDRIAVMSAGKVLQLAEPTKIYRAPADAKVAAFVGRGSILRGMCVETNTASATVEIAGHRFKARARNSTSGPVTVLLRPEGLALAEQGIPATVLSAIYRGPVYEVRLAVPGGEIVLDCAHAPSTGAQLHVTINDAWVVPCP
jgi:iron(III) transport system ATP-binding protein